MHLHGALNKAVVDVGQHGARRVEGGVEEHGVRLDLEGSGEKAKKIF